MTDKTPNIDKSKENPFFSTEGVGKGWRSAIEIRFQTLIDQFKQKPYQWYKDLNLDKGDASKIRRGILIPPEYLRIKIASYFQTDTSAIWKPEEITEYTLIDYQNYLKLIREDPESFTSEIQEQNELHRDNS